MNMLKKFVRREDGLVTIEWVGIAAVMVLAAIGIKGFLALFTLDASAPLPIMVGVPVIEALITLGFLLYKLLPLLQRD